MSRFFTLEASCSSYLGSGRSINEDNFYFNKKRLVKHNSGMHKYISAEFPLSEPVAFAVFDGIGGASYGEEASYLASKVFSEKMKELDDVVLNEKEFLLNICRSATYAVNSFSRQKQLSQIGTTLVSVLFADDEVFICNVGDSKAFLLRDNKFMQISKDHTDEEFLKSIGVEKKPSLLQYIGMSTDEGGLDPFISKGKIMENDVYVLCSDGVSDVLDIHSIFKTIKEEKSTDRMVEKIINDVKLADGQDNATIIIIKCSR